ncbi:hypothetical protein ACIBCT_35100 [Streptosporangium sp. NPDC050855]|uniref:hypothetical protein n=1 Tax=Streptosporangium sp. NPDC050855 TaxID=3366194 RepID=UPI0037BA26D2
MRLLPLATILLVLAGGILGCGGASALPEQASLPSSTAPPSSTAARDLASKLTGQQRIPCTEAEPEGEGVLDAARCELLGKPLHITAYADATKARAAAERLYEELRQQWDFPLVLTYDTWVLDASADRSTGVAIWQMFPDATKFGS